MRVKGALHIHTTLSHDGTLSFAELAEFFRARGYSFLAMGEHAEDFDTAKVMALLRECAAHSTSDFLLIPGLEFVCGGDIHIVGLGAPELIASRDPLVVIERIHAQGGFAVLAHPKRIGWQCPEAVLRAVDAAEVWNVGYDGKFLPSPQALPGIRGMQAVNPGLKVVAAQDFHRKPSFYDVGVWMDVGALSREAVLENLRAGRYAVRSPHFRCSARAEIPWWRERWLGLLSSNLRHLRRARSYLQSL